ARAAGAAALAPSPLPARAGAAPGVRPPPLGQALRPGRAAARHEEGRVTAARRETAGGAAGEGAAREAERGAGPPAEVGAVALLPAVDDTVAAERALAGVEVALRAGERARREAEGGAGGAP